MLLKFRIDRSLSDQYSLNATELSSQLSNLADVLYILLTIRYLYFLLQSLKPNPQAAFAKIVVRDGARE
ncbi:hypothetical protein Cha6605_5338 [Chamaesiphon minutus PCC 6605]|uniref:Uncharacterized protein n=1 Tax=Chamaesiphon minutus (strain ATCC 27169 / PCC 6605) TaxID=1173020 RepID=K9UN36_CHAP6|nr:hypothetical protein Cha6605_5338 [Chamaesiphon minutus PCC 6605]